MVSFGAGDETVAGGETLQWSFDDQPAGQEPVGVTSFDGSWSVQEGDGAESPPNELCQTETAKFPAMQLGDDVMTDLTMSARIKPLTGEEDQAAGLIFRAQDSTTTTFPGPTLSRRTSAFTSTPAGTVPLSKKTRPTSTPTSADSVTCFDNVTVTDE